MKKEILTILAAAIAFVAPAGAEDFTAGKTPAQLFRSDCSDCHAQPAGLLKRRRAISDLTEFLREHYTTKAESAAALATYLAGFPTATAAAVRAHPRKGSQPHDAPAAADTGADARTPDARTPDARTPDVRAPDARTPDSQGAEPDTAESGAPGNAGPKVSESRTSEPKTSESKASQSRTSGSRSKASGDNAHHKKHRRTRKNPAGARPAAASDAPTASSDVPPEAVPPEAEDQR